MTQIEIEELVSGFKQSAPVRVVALARELGLRVMRTNQWDLTVSGAIVGNQDGAFTVWTNARHPEIRRRFTIAHEVAHYVLRRDAIGDGIRDDALFRSSLGGILERQASSYAADLLMPWNLVNQCFDEGADSIEKLAAALRVSKTAMSIRLGIPWE